MGPGHPDRPPDRKDKLVARRSRRDDLAIFDGVRRGGAPSPGRPIRRPGGGSLRLVALVTAGLVLTAGAIFGVWALVKAWTTTDAVELRVLGVEEPIVGAVVEGPEGSGVTETEGVVMLGFQPPATLVVTAPGYVTGSFDVAGLPEGPLFLQMEPQLLKGRVTTSDGVGVAGATVRAGDLETVTGEFGSFEITAAPTGPIEVTKAAWESTTADWDGSEGRLDITLDPFVVRGLRIDAEAAADPDRFSALLRLADTTMVNALIMDTKNEAGTVHYRSEVALPAAIAGPSAFYDVEAELEAIKARDLYAITRIVTFQDPVAALEMPDHALHDPEGALWFNDAGFGWLDPTDREAWEYPLGLAVEACQLGFDEIQFDYVRFPTDGDVTRVVADVELDQTTRTETIAAFLEEARTRLHPLGCAVSADVFAIILSTEDDQGLGQRPEDLSWSVDALSPMVYPSHYSPGWLGFADPNDYPAEVTGNALDAGMPRIVGGAVLRPWLQGFGWTTGEIAAAIDQAEARGLGWMLWNAKSEHDPDAIPIE